MTYDELPKKALSLGAAVVSGILLALWCMPLFDSKPRPMGYKPGFSIIIPVSQAQDLSKTSDLRGKTVQILRTGTPETESCVIEHAPLTLAVQEHLLILSGAMESLEKFALNVWSSDLRTLELIDSNGKRGVKPCRTSPKVTYGD